MEMQPLNFALRECSRDDASTLALVGSATFLEAYAGLLPAESILWHTRTNHSLEAYESLLDQPGSRAWVAEIPPTWAKGRGAPVGYAVLSAPDFAPNLIHPGDVELKRIYTFSRFQGLAVGQQLFETVLAAAQSSHSARLLLGVHRDNQRALAFYARNKFSEVGARQFRLGDNTFDDLVLGRGI
jgi:ribosomal protein S18 acetylase RimI-like enzyme